MPDHFDFDVFLSHNQADKPRVRQLAEQLRAAGLRVWLDEWVIQPGDDIYLAIERGLEASRTLVLCLSPAALGSDWMGLERSTVLFRDPTGKERRFIPVLLADCRLPDALRRYKYVDLRDGTEAAFQELLSACHRSKKPAARRKQAAEASTDAGPTAPTAPPRSAGLELAGHWAATARPDGGKPYQVYLSFKTLDKVLLGTVSYPTGNAGILNGKIEGDSFSFMTQHVPQFSSQEATIQWYGKLVGQALQGIIQSPDSQSEFTAERSKKPQRYGWTAGGRKSG